MKIKYITAIGALGSALAVVPPCLAQLTSAAGQAPSLPKTAVWDGSEYVGEVDGRYYYQGPNNTWLNMDQAHQQRFEDWQKNNPNWNHNQQPGENQNTRSQGAVGTENPNTGQPNQMGNTRSHGPAEGQQYPYGQPGPIQNQRYQGPEIAPDWKNPSDQPAGIRNTRHQGHDMGQSHAVAPPVQPNSNPP